jgi:hypothetical protein
MLRLRALVWGEPQIAAELGCSPKAPPRKMATVDKRSSSEMQCLEQRYSKRTKSATDTIGSLRI